jgi:hypothetical protein
MAVEAPVNVLCGACRRTYALSARNAREHRKAGRDPVCEECRHRPRIVITEPLRAHWTARYSSEQIVELARDAFG